MSYFGARVFNVTVEQANHWRVLYANMQGEKIESLLEP